jgi:D-3-phosphoglycerate dehydrogenase
VVEALAGKLSANAVNAPMVAPEVLRELQPYVTLAEGLGKVGGGGGVQGTPWQRG